MDTLIRDDVLRLAGAQISPCVSIYLSTHRANPAAAQDSLRFRNALRISRDRFAAGGSTPREAEALLARAVALGDDRAAVFHGHGVDDSKDRLLRYFRQMDRELQDLPHDEQAPLVLAAVDYLAPIYREANTDRHLLDDSVAGNPEARGAEELRSRARVFVKPHSRQSERDAAAAIFRY